MKKTISLLLTLALAVSAFAACGGGASSSSSVPTVSVPSDAVIMQQDSPDRVSFNVAALNGPTAMGLIKLMNDTKTDATINQYNVTTYGAADEFTAQLVKGEIDVALIPCNLASVLYNKTKGAIQIAAVNTLGVLQMISADTSVKTIADLKGRTIYATGKGTTPEYLLNYVLTQNGIDPEKDVTIEYATEAAAVVTSLQQSVDATAVAMLPQPYATTALMQNEGYATVLDLTKEWNAVSDGTDLVTGVVVAQKSFIEANPEAFKTFLEEYKGSVDYVLANTADAAQMIADFGIVAKAAVAEKALPQCNITFLTGKEMKSNVAAYLQVLFDQNPEAVGGTLPADDFYYGA